MISLQQLLGKEEKFFDLFEASAGQCRQSVKALKALAQDPGQKTSLEEFITCRRKDKAIHAEITEALCTSVVTALERDDIMALAQSLYKIPKTVEKMGERILLAPKFLQGFDLSAQVDMLEKGTATLLTMLQAMRRRAGIEEVKKLNDHLQIIEGDADKMVLDLLGVLYHEDIEGKRVTFLKDLFELFEQVTDRYRDAGNVIVQIVLKNT
jgi:uncharacterized protein Yka (UPF0111/DUF47 family)